MAPRIQLNKFVRVQTDLVNSTPLSVYIAPPHRAAIIISALVNNNTNSVQTVTGAISSTVSNSFAQNNYTPINFIKDFAIAPKDAVNIVVNKLVLQDGDNFIISSGSSNQGDVNLTLSILETRNDQ